MRKCKKKICSIVLSFAMVATGVMEIPVVSYGAEASGITENGRSSEALSGKKNWFDVSDNFSGVELNETWSDEAGNVEWTDGKLHMKNNGGIGWKMTEREAFEIILCC